MSALYTAGGIMPASTFDQPRLLFSDYPLPQKPTTLCNFITFLAVAQKLQIPFLPITWQSEKESLGKGRTGNISQALLNLQASLAFKRVEDKYKRDESEGEIFRCLINEITLLRHPAVQNHPNLLELQGICWDIPSKKVQDDAEAALPCPSNDNKIWPVLVFEKAHFEDLYHFSRLPIGRELAIDDRWKICLDIGSAIGHMHSNGIIHGDIKPQNVLVFKDKGGAFLAKVADFGFSTWCADGESRIKIPESRPWSAPERNEYRDFAFEQAAKTDVFSFGMLCLWLLFEQKFSGVLPLSTAAQLATTSQIYREVGTPLAVLDDLKRRAALPQFANQLVMDEVGLDTETKQMLQQFFSGCLACDPEARDADIQRLLKHVNVHHTQPVAEKALAEVYSPADHDFKLFPSLYELYSSDYRLRCYILKSLEEIVTKHPTSPLSTQLAFCHELGFGGMGHHEQPRPFLYNREDIEIRLRQAISPESAVRNHVTLYNDMLEIGHGSLMVLSDIYREHSVLETAEAVLRNDAQNVGHILGADHAVVLRVQVVLSSIMREQGRWEDMESLDVQVMETRKRVLGEEHPDTLSSMESLVSSYLHQGRHDEAESLQVQVMEINKRELGDEHPYTLISMSGLTWIYLKQGRHGEAESLEVRATEVRKRVLGEEHPHTLESMASLALVYWSQGRYEEAESLQIQVIDIRGRVLGEEHPYTLESMTNLVMTYMAQGRHEEAESLDIQVMEIRKRVLGKEHPDTLESMDSLAVRYWDQGRYEEAESLQVQVMEISMRALGEEHPDTLSRMEEVVSAYKNQGRLEKAESLGVHMIEVRQRVLGKEHPDTQGSMALLAWIYEDQGRYKEAELLRA